MYFATRISLTRTLPERAVAALVLACPLLFACGAAARSTASAERTNADVIGASIVHPAKWSVERERYTIDGTYGFTWWKPESDSATHDHGGTPAVRVAQAYDLEPGQIEAKVRDRLTAYPHPPLTREKVSVGRDARRRCPRHPDP